MTWTLCWRVKVAILNFYAILYTVLTFIFVHVSINNSTCFHKIQRTQGFSTVLYFHITVFPNFTHTHKWSYAHSSDNNTAKLQVSFHWSLSNVSASLWIQIWKHHLEDFVHQGTQAFKMQHTDHQLVSVILRRTILSCVEWRLQEARAGRGRVRKTVRGWRSGSRRQFVLLFCHCTYITYHCVWLHPVKQVTCKCTSRHKSPTFMTKQWPRFCLVLRNWSKTEKSDLMIRNLILVNINCLF